MVKCYLRYCDDFALFSNDKKLLNEIKFKIIEFLETELKLSLSKCDLFRTTQGVDFLGYRHFKDYILIRKSTVKRVKDITEIFNKELIFTSFSISRSNVQGCEKYITIQFKETETSPLRIAFTSSQVLMDQFLEYEEQLPFVATIKKVNRYMTLT